MKRIIGFFTLLSVVMIFGETSSAAPQDMMMKKQPNVMTVKPPTVRKSRKKMKYRQVKKYSKNRKTVR